MFWFSAWNRIFYIWMLGEADLKGFGIFFNVLRILLSPQKNTKDILTPLNVGRMHEIIGWTEQNSISLESPK